MKFEVSRESDSKKNPSYRSHFLPRSRTGALTLLVFCALFLLVEPPLLSYANRIEPWILGLPALYVYLSVTYLALISVLIWAYLRDL